tara:strand:- start:505 stop:708 length:204 start_codon:yes stop_codon:yes gene_type:complete
MNLEHKRQAAVAYNTTEKTYCITSEEIAQAMLFMGNQYGFNRAKVFPQKEVATMNELMKQNGFKSIA